MSVRINLLPEATKQRDRAAHQRSLVALAGVVVLAGFGGIFLWSSGQVTDAEVRLADEQARNTELRGSEAELLEFAELASRQSRSVETLRTAMGAEVSIAGLMQDVAMVMPDDSQLETLQVTLTNKAVAEEDEPVTSIGNLAITGKSLNSHAPGVERVLISLEKVSTFDELFLTSSTLDVQEGRVTTFSVDGQIATTAPTGRYSDGLPEELR